MTNDAVIELARRPVMRVVLWLRDKKGYISHKKIEMATSSTSVIYDEEKVYSSDDYEDSTAECSGECVCVCVCVCVWSQC